METFKFGLKLIGIPLAALIAMFFFGVMTGSEFWFDLSGCLLSFVMPVYILAVIIGLTVQYFVEKKKKDESKKNL